MSRIDNSIEVSVLITDIRNFTPNLKNGEIRPDGHNTFCQFLGEFYDCCVQACSIACGGQRPRQLYLNSTGDGVLGVFLSPERHFLDAYLAGIILSLRLPPLCDAYNQTKSRYVADVSFGIGIESGHAWRVISYDYDGEKPRIIDTFIGDCIDVAARVENATKDHSRTTMLMSSHINQRLCQYLYQEDYNQLIQEAVDESIFDEERQRLWEKMKELNEKVLVTYIGTHNLRGVTEPVPLFRLSPTLASPKRQKFREFVRRLSLDDTHFQRIMDFIESV